MEKCLELAEDYTVKKHRFHQLVGNEAKSIADLKRAEQEKKEAKQRYISFLTNVSTVNLHEKITSE